MQGLTAEQLDKMARSTALATLASTQQIREAQDVLLTFRSISGPIFEETVALSQDLAVVMGGDAKQAALQLAKALEEPTIGLTALRRSGVSFSQTEKDLIKDMAETNRLAEAQALILEKVRQQVGGAGAAEAGGLSGSVDTLSQRWDEFLESLGQTQGVVDPAKSSLDLLSRSLNGWANFFNPSDEMRLNELLQERIEHQERLNEIWFDPSGNRRKYSEMRIESINKEIAAIQNANIERMKAEADAQQMSVMVKMGMSIDTDMGNSKLKQDTETLLAEQEKVVREAYQKRLKEIETFTLSEKALKEKGFQSEAEMRQVYMDDALAAHDAQLAKIDEKRQTELTKQQKQSGTILTNLENQLAGQEERIKLRYQKEEDQINKLVLSKQQIEAQGYTSLEALQTAYLEKAQLNRDAAIERLNEKQAQQEEKQTQRTIKMLEKQKTAWERHSEQLGKTMENLEQAGISWTNGFTDAMTDMVTKGKLDFSDLATSIIADLVKIQIQSQITQPLAQMMGSFFSPTASVNMQGQSSPLYNNTAFVKQLHTGGIVGGSEGAPRAVNASVFANAPRFHTGGIVGNEVPAVLQKGEGVFTKEQMRSLSPAGGGDIKIEIINSGQPMKVDRQEQGMMGDTRKLKLFISQIARGAINEDVARGQGAAAIMESQYGLVRKTR